MLLDNPKFAFWDECSNIRHILARLKLCKHKGEWLNGRQYFKKIYDDLPMHGKYFDIVKAPKDEE